MVSHRIANVLRSRSPSRILESSFKPAAVLMPVQERDDDDYLVLTKRAEHLTHHRGQVAFPGGRVDAEDAGPLEAALRESHEEIGVLPGDVRILGQLDQVRGAYGFLITPFVGVIPSCYEFRLNRRETAAVFAVPMSALLDPASVKVDEHLSWHGEPVYHFYFDDRDIWGATARMIVQFLELVYDYKVKQP